MKISFKYSFLTAQLLPYDVKTVISTFNLETEIQAYKIDEFFEIKHKNKIFQYIISKIDRLTSFDKNENTLTVNYFIECKQLSETTI